MNHEAEVSCFSARDLKEIEELTPFQFQCDWVG